MKATSAFLVFAVSVLNGQPQTIDRQVQFTHAETPQQMQEIATAVRSVSLVPQVSVEAAARSISLRGEPGQIETAEWLLGRLDRPVAQPGEYRVPGDEKEGAVKILVAPSLDTPQRLQEVATVLRATCEIRRVFTYNAHAAIVVRSSAELAGCAEWLLSKILKRPEVAASAELRLSLREGMVHVVPLKRPATAQDLQQLVTLLRHMSLLRWVFTLPSPGTLVLRGLPEQLALAEWLVAKLDVPTAERQNTERHEHAAAVWPGNPQVAVRLVLLPSNANDLDDLAQTIRNRTDARNLQTYAPAKALAFHSIPSVAKAADQVIAERYR
jgi:hypothetical protein